MEVRTSSSWWLKVWRTSSGLHCSDHKQLQSFSGAQHLEGDEGSFCWFGRAVIRNDMTFLAAKMLHEVCYLVTHHDISINFIIIQSLQTAPRMKSPIKEDSVHSSRHLHPSSQPRFLIWATVMTYYSVIHPEAHYSVTSMNYSSDTNRKGEEFTSLSDIESWV